MRKTAKNIFYFDFGKVKEMAMIAEAIERIRKGPKYRYRSAETGQYVSRLYALLHPSTTVRERVR